MECARLFHERLTRTMDQFIYLDGGKRRGVLGRVTDFLIRYEVQDRGWVSLRDRGWVSLRVLAGT